MILLAVLLLINCGSFLPASATGDWNISMLQGFPAFSTDRVTLEELVKANILNMGDMGCVFNANAPHHSINKWHVWDSDMSEMVQADNFLNGTTLWINEHMAVGHVMYDLWIIEALKSSKITRIVIQRAPCINADLCVGLGSWGTFFRGFYTALIDAFQPGVPLYLRFSPREFNLTPIYLSGNSTNVDGEFTPFKREKSFMLANRVCLERVVKRQCNHCFYPSVSPASAKQLKVAAYNLVTDKKLIHHFPEGKAIEVLFAHRGLGARRHIDNIQYFIDHLKSTVTTPDFNFKVNCSSNNYMTHQTQIAMVAEAQIVIAEHGAFQSNIMYMRKGSLFIELRGNYKHGEFINFEKLARMFGVFYAHVVTSQIDWHTVSKFNITASETEQVVSIINRYRTEAPHKLKTRTQSVVPANNHTDL
jgi:hypothetical protein